MKWYISFHCKSVYEVPLSFYLKEGVRQLVVDLDNTLEPYDIPFPSPRVMELKKKLSEAGIEMLIVSNNTKRRVSQYCESLGVRYLSMSMKFTSLRIRKWMKKLSLNLKDVMFVGDQLYTDGIYTRKLRGRFLLTDPLVEHDHFGTRWMRKLDKKTRKKLKEKNQLGVEIKPIGGNKDVLQEDESQRSYR